MLETEGKITCVRVDISGGRAIVSDVLQDGSYVTDYDKREDGARISAGDISRQRERALARSIEHGVPFAFSNHDLFEQVLNARAARDEFDKIPGKVTV